MYKNLLSKHTKVPWPCMAQAPTHEPPFWDFHCPGPPVAPGATAWAVMAAFVAPGATAWVVKHPPTNLPSGIFIVQGPPWHLVPRHGL